MAPPREARLHLPLPALRLAGAQRSGLTIYKNVTPSSNRSTRSAAI
jgi:hypothetical protein